MGSTARQQPESSGHRTEVFATVLLSLAAVLAAWSLFQSAKWSGRQTIALSEAAAARTRAARLAVQADQQLALHVSLFVAWTQAVAAEVTPEELRDRGYRVRAGTLSGFLYARFPTELTAATAAWLATKPFENPEAPRTPFSMPQYRSEARGEADRLNEEASRRSVEAIEFNARSDRYVAMNILFAMVLFFAGIATKLEGRWPRLIMLGVASVAVLAACGVLASYPVALG